MCSRDGCGFHSDNLSLGLPSNAEFYGESENQGLEVMALCSAKLEQKRIPKKNFSALTLKVPVNILLDRARFYMGETAPWSHPYAEFNADSENHIFFTPAHFNGKLEQKQIPKKNSLHWHSALA